MGPGGAPQKSIFWSQKLHFPDFLFRGSVEGRGGGLQNETLPPHVSGSGGSKRREALMFGRYARAAGQRRRQIPLLILEAPLGVPQYCTPFTQMPKSQIGIAAISNRSALKSQSASEITTPKSPLNSVDKRVEALLPKRALTLN